MDLPSKVSPSESLARYLTQHNHYSTSKNVVKPSAFQPPSNLRLSVFRIDGLILEEVWEIGRVNVVSTMPLPKENVYGFANIIASAVCEMDLDVDPDNNPPRHADIVGWPQEKSERMLIAQELAARATLRLRY